jgi:hypothetical protein
MLAATGAGFAAFANIKYQRAREAERDAVQLQREKERDNAQQAREAVREQDVRKREEERQQRLAIEARAVLGPELRANLAAVTQIRSLLQPTGVPLARFQTSAWQTVAGSELVRGVTGKEVAILAAVYERAISVNDMLGTLTELNVGVSSALGGSLQTRKVYADALKEDLLMLEAALKNALRLVFKETID